MYKGAYMFLRMEQKEFPSKKDFFNRSWIWKKINMWTWFDEINSHYGIINDVSQTRLFLKELLYFEELM